MRKIIILLSGIGLISCEDIQLIHHECPIGQTRECSWDSESIRRPVGLCKFGIQKCMATGWSDCDGAVGPTEEICDGYDNDCDLHVDESYPEENQLCGFIEGINYGVGVCKPGISTCVNGVIYCEGHIGPSEEFCDNLDNDCNGTIDDNIPNQTAIVCYEGPLETLHVGECRAGVQYCSEGGFGECEGQILPTIERCDNLDNDCDGLVDEGMDESPVDIVFVLDVSGSFNDEIGTMIAGITPLLSDPVTSNFRFGLVAIGTRDRKNTPGDAGPGSNFEYMRLMTDFVPAAEFLSFLNESRIIPSSGREPSYDALAYIMDGTMGLTFSEISQKVIILMTDEEGQTYNDPAGTPMSCFELARDNFFNIYIFALTQHWTSFAAIIDSNQTRYFSPSVNSSVVFQQIRSIFDGLCLGE